MGDADFWELLTKHGIAPDSATAIVKSHGSMQDADLWERLVQNGAQPDAATSIVQSRGAPASTDISLKNIARSAGNAATLGFADKFGAVDDDALKAFKKEHPIADLAAKVGGGALLPLVATLGIPALATLGGVVGTGAVVGGITAANESDGDLADRAKSFGIGAGAGGVGGLAGYAGSKLLGGVARGVADAVRPERAATRLVGAMGKELLPNPTATQATMDAANAVAPGSASIATSEVPKELGQSRFRFAADAIGKNPEAAASTEHMLKTQMGEAQKGLRRIGQDIDKLVVGRNVTVTPQLRSALSKAADVLGGHSPTAPPAGPLQVAAPPGFQATSLTVPTPSQSTVPLAELRDGLSRLRFLRRQILMRDSDRINGAALHEVNQAEAALKAEVYAADPKFASLDQPYAQVSRQRDEAENLLTAVQRSRSRYATNRAHGAEEASTGGSIHTTATGNALAALKSILPKTARGRAVADATARMVLTPGADVASLLNAAPKPGVVGPAVRTGLLGTLPAALRGLLFPADNEQP